MEYVVTPIPVTVAAEVINEKLRALQSLPTLFLLSGGSSLKVLDEIDTSLLGAHITIVMSDERFSTDPTSNNCAQLQATNFYTAAITAGVTLIDTTVQAGETLATYTARYEAALRQWRETHPDGIAILTMGIGEDGHTAGMIPPAPHAVFADTAWVVGYDIPESSKDPFRTRVSVTFTFLRENAASVVVQTAGVRKQSALAALLAVEGTIEQTPARILLELPDATVVTDQTLT